MENEGKVIVIEGVCDGVGKSTQLSLLYDYLKDTIGTVTTHHFPSYNTEQGIFIEKYLKGEFGKKEDLSPYFINTIFAIDRYITWNNEFKKIYESGNTILFDRYTTSSLIYQSALYDLVEEKEKFIDFVTNYEYNLLGIKEPDIVIFLTAPFELIYEMIKNRSKENQHEEDIHENDYEYLKKVYDNGSFVAEYLNWKIINCEKDGKFKSIEEIHKDIIKVINE